MNEETHGLIKSAEDAISDNEVSPALACYVPVGSAIDTVNVAPASERITTSNQTYIHLLKGNVGSGILALPNAFKHSGLIGGLIGLQFIAIIAIHCMHLLLQSSSILCEKFQLESLSYAQTAQFAFESTRNYKGLGRPALLIINLFLCVTQIGFCCVYIVFVSENLKQVMDLYLPHYSKYTYMVTISFLLIFLCWIRDLSYLAPLSMAANISIVAGLITTFIVVLTDLPYSYTRKAFAPVGQLPLFFGTAIYAFEGIGVILPLENKMRDRHELRGTVGVLNSAMVLVLCLYTAVGFFGYLRFGDQAAGSITINLPQSSLIAQLVCCFMSVAILLTYTLMIYVPYSILLPSLLSRLHTATQKTLIEYTFRTTLVVFTLLVACIVPDLGDVISLVGAVSSSMLALVFPPLIHLLVLFTHQRHVPHFHAIAAKNVFITLVGLCGFVTGTWCSISNVFLH